jgi:hypothetical protein
MAMRVPLPGSSETLNFETADARADGRRRMVCLSRDLVVIARQREGVRMRIALRPHAFQGALLRVAVLADGAFRYEVSLAHRDPEFDVAVASCQDRRDAEAAWKSLARFVDAPALVEREAGRYEEVFVPRRAAGIVHARRRGRGVGARRPRFLARRKIGRGELAVAVSKERELFGAWREGV